MKQCFKTKMTSMAIALSLLTGGVTVLADEVPSDALAIDLGANITIQTGEDNPGQYLAFTPSTTGFYRFWSDTSGYSENETNDTYLTLYDSAMNRIGFNDNTFRNKNSELSIYLTANETYYLFATTHAYHYISDPVSCRFDVHIGPGYGGTVEGAVCEYSFFEGGCEDVLVSVTSDSEYSLIANAPSIEGVTYEYDWYLIQPFELLDEESNTLTLSVREGAFYCNIMGSDGSDYDLYFDITFDSGFGWSDNKDAGYMLVAPDTSFVLYHDYTINDDSAMLYPWASPIVFGAGSDRSEDWAEGGNLIYSEQDQSVVVSGGVSDFAVIKYGISTDYEESIRRFEYIFVLGDEIDGTLESGVPVHIDVYNELPDEGGEDEGVFFGDSDFTLQKIYSFTPESDGTALLEASEIMEGVACVAVFDENCNLICAANDFGYFTDPDGFYIEDAREVPLNGGVTYYLAVSIFDRFEAEFGEMGDALSADYNLTLTFTPDEQPAEIPAEESTDAPAAPETTHSDAVTSTPAAPAGNPAPDDAPVVASSNFSIGDFVERLYTVALGRSSDPAGKQDWIDAITLRGQTGADAARGFLYSPEFLGKQSTNEEFVATLYRTFFDREPDQAGFNAWVEVLNNGGAKEDVIEGFINSTEWANLCILYGVRSGGTGVPNIAVEPNQQIIDFATRLYTTCLGRDADQNGLMAWARQLSNQRDTGTGAARGFFFSEEFIRQNVSNDEYVNRLYRTFMDRDADEAGFNAWVAQLNNGASREEVFEGFAQSPEFARICGSYGIIR